MTRKGHWKHEDRVRFLIDIFFETRSALHFFRPFPLQVSATDRDAVASSLVTYFTDESEVCSERVRCSEGGKKEKNFRTSDPVFSFFVRIFLRQSVCAVHR